MISVSALPATGAAWENLVDGAQFEIGIPNLHDQSEDTDVRVLAKALVGIRLNDPVYLNQVREAVLSVIGTESVEGEVTIANPLAVETTATFSAPGTYLLRLSAHDGVLQDEDEISIRVHPNGAIFTPTGTAALDGTGTATMEGTPTPTGENNDPDVYAGADQIVSVADTVTLRGTVTDDGLPIGTLTTTWEVIEPRTLATARNLAAYVIAADLVRLEPAQDAVFRDWLSQLLHKNIDGRTLANTQEDRANNWGTMAAASRAAAAAYLGDHVELDRTAQVFRGFLGDRSAYADFDFESDASWQADPSAPVGINQVSLVQWDLSGIPSGVTVTAVNLTVNVINTSVHEFEVYEALRAWDERTATFKLSATGQTWGTPGVAGPTDRASKTLAALTSPRLGLLTVPFNVDGVATVQGWIGNIKGSGAYIAIDGSNN